jgi:hypothetical protein
MRRFLVRRLKRYAKACADSAEREMREALKAIERIERLEGVQADPHAAYVTRIDSPMFRPNPDDPGVERPRRTMP